MANEATLIFETHLPIPMTCSTSTAVEKGTVMKLSDPFTASAQTALNDVVAGICAGEVLSTNSGKVAVYRGGIFKMVISGSGTAGDPVVTATGNKVVVATVNQENVLGILLETCTDGESALVELRPTTMQLA